MSLISVHRVTSIRASKAFPESDWMYLTFNYGDERSPDESFTLTVFMLGNARLTTDIVDVINALPTADDPGYTNTKIDDEDKARRQVHTAENEPF